MEKGSFIAKNNGLELPDKKNLIPEIYVGCQFLADGFMISLDYGFLQQTLMIGGGFTIPLKAKK